MLGIETFQNVDVFQEVTLLLAHAVDVFAGYRSRREAKGYDQMEPGFALRATPRQPSLASLR
jgi:hypothetical protein